MTKTFQDVTQYLQINLESGSCEIAPTFPGVTALDYLMQLKKILSLILLKNNQWKKVISCELLQFPKYFF